MKDCKVCGNVIASFNKHRNKCYDCKPREPPDNVFWKYHETSGEPLYMRVWNRLTKFAK